MQGVHRVIQSFFLFDVVSGHMKQLPSPYHECFLCSRNAVGESSLINLKECSLVQIPRLAGRPECVSNSPECFRRNGLQHRLQFRYDGAGDPYWEVTRVRHCRRA